jgi:hypothetical protein
MLEGRKELFRLRIPATLAYQQVFGITLEGGGKDQLFAQQICETAYAMSCFVQDYTASSRFLRWNTSTSNPPAMSIRCSIYLESEDRT